MAAVNELVQPAIFLSSQAASFCTGVDLIVDGGFVCRSGATPSKPDIL
jgi:NAD(P)-dependent dehydrogenase (short-subunit alcohol dehydrogenase family)